MLHMISNGIRNRIEVKCDLHESKIIAGIKKCKNTRIKRERVQLLAKCTISSNTCTIETKRPISGRANPESSESNLVSVCVKRTARVYKQCAQNNNKINCSHKITK